jgi:hypothetical protein
MRLSAGRVHYFREKEFGEQLSNELYQTGDKILALDSLLKFLEYNFSNLTIEQASQQMSSFELSNIFKSIAIQVDSIGNDIESIGESIDGEKIDALNKFDAIQTLIKWREIDEEEEKELMRKQGN